MFEVPIDLSFFLIKKNLNIRFSKFCINQKPFVSNASKCSMQNELCKCFVHEIIREVVLLHLNMTKLTKCICHFVMENPVSLSRKCLYITKLLDFILFGNFVSYCSYKFTQILQVIDQKLQFYQLLGSSIYQLMRRDLLMGYLLLCIITQNVIFRQK